MSTKSSPSANLEMTFKLLSDSCDSDEEVFLVDGPLLSFIEKKQRSLTREHAPCILLGARKLRSGLPDNKTKQNLKNKAANWLP